MATDLIIIRKYVLHKTNVGNYIKKVWNMFFVDLVCILTLVWVYTFAHINQGLLIKNTANVFIYFIFLLHWRTKSFFQSKFQRSLET